ncbi:MAG: hypothetical protein ACYTX0_28635 [Nostoc sp.]
MALPAAGVTLRQAQGNTCAVPFGILLRGASPRVGHRISKIDY